MEFCELKIWIERQNFRGWGKIAIHGALRAHKQKCISWMARYNAKNANGTERENFS